MDVLSQILDVQYVTYDIGGNAGTKEMADAIAQIAKSKLQK